METLQAIKTRRSTRKFKQMKVEDALLQEVIEAGRFAPSGGNCQTTHFMVVTNRSVLEDLAVLVREEFSKMEVTEGMYKSIVHSIVASKKGDYVFHYEPAALIITANQKDYGNNIADCSCALENMMIAANELSLGSCWINQLKWLNENEAVLAYLRKLGLKENERVYGALAVGYADTKNGLPVRDPLPRTGNEVTYIS